MDIYEWAKGRGEKIVKYRAKRRVPNILTGQIEEEVEEGEMPESFWNGLLWKDGWHYTELERLTPHQDS